MKNIPIGEMARICNVSIQTLRYYDKINLVKPVERDVKNNYRYYSIKQVFQLNIIKYLQYSGLSIDEIRETLQLKGSGLVNFLEEQSKKIDQQIARLHNSQQLINGQIQQLNELEKIQKHPLEHVYQKSFKAQIVLQKVLEHDVTPLDYPDEETSELDNLLIENGTVGNLQYGFGYPFGNYQSLSEIKYHQVFTQIFVWDASSVKNTVIIPAGEYLCIPFYWDRANYLDYYQKLRSEYLKKYPDVETTVYEVSSVDQYGYDSEADFIAELRLKMPK